MKFTYCVVIILIMSMVSSVFGSYQTTSCKDVYSTEVLCIHKCAWSGVGDIIRNTGMTPVIDTSEVESVYLTFSHKYDVHGSDVAQVYINIFGWAWTKIAEYMGHISEWTDETVQLPEWSYGEGIKIKFVYITYENSTGEGWYVDDICVKHHVEDGEEIILYKNDFEEYLLDSKWGHWTIIEEEVPKNDPPSLPTLTGPQRIKVSEENQYLIQSFDPNNDDVLYYIEWGDGECNGWLGPYLSGAEVLLNHSWVAEGEYGIKVRSKDVFGMESDWSTFKISVPKNKDIFRVLFCDIFKVQKSIGLRFVFSLIDSL